MSDRIVYADFDGTIVSTNSFHYLYYILWNLGSRNGEP